MNITSVDTMETIVAKGVEYLDSRYPGWRWRVDADTIEGQCIEHCVTGQLFGEEITDQLRGAGLSPSPLDTLADSSRIMTEFAGMGFAVLAQTPFYPSEATRADAAANGIELPDVIPIPRDYDTIIMEAETLTMLWQREVSKR